MTGCDNLESDSAASKVTLDWNDGGKESGGGFKVVCVLGVFVGKELETSPLVLAMEVAAIVVVVELVVVVGLAGREGSGRGCDKSWSCVLNPVKDVEEELPEGA